MNCKICGTQLKPDFNFCPECATKITNEESKQMEINNMDTEDYISHIGLDKYINLNKCHFNDDYISLVSHMGNEIFVSYENNYKKEFNGIKLVDIRSGLKYYKKFDDNFDNIKNKFCAIPFWEKAFQGMALIIQMEDVFNNKD